MNFDDYTKDDTVEFTFEFPSIPSGATRSGVVQRFETVPDIGEVMVVLVELSLHKAEYAIYADPDDVEEQVIKTRMDRDETLGTFGPVTHME